MFLFKPVILKLDAMELEPQFKGKIFIDMLETSIDASQNGKNVSLYISDGVPLILDACACEPEVLIFYPFHKSKVFLLV